MDVEEVTFEDIAGVGPSDEDPITGDPINSEVEEDEEETVQEDESTTEDSNQSEPDDSDAEVQAEDEEEVQGDDDETVDETAEEDEALRLTDEIKETLGYELDGEYEDTIEGLVELTKDAAGQMAEQELGGLFSQFPEVQDLLQYRLNGGDPETFFDTYKQSLEWSDVEFDEENADQHEQIVASYFQSEGWDNDEIKETIEDFRESGILDRQANRFLDKLAEKQENQKEELLKQQQKKKEEQQEQIKEFWNDVEEKVDKARDFKGLPIKEAQKDEFFDYLSKPVNEQGMSQRDVDVQNADMETQLAMDLLLYYDFDLSDIIDKKAKSKKAGDLRERLKRSSDRNGLKDKSNTVSGSNDDVDADQLVDISELDI